MPEHNVRHLYSVRRTTSRGVDHPGGLAEILRAERGRGDHTERRRILLPIVIKPVNGAAGQSLNGTLSKMNKLVPFTVKLWDVGPEVNFGRLAANL